MNVRKVDSILFFVPDIDAAAKWYAAIFSASVEYENPLYAFVTTAFATFGFHPADEKCPGGAGGSVTYLEVEHLGAAIEKFSSHGARLFRGPITTSLGASVAMVRDPFGSLLGFIQPATKHAEIATPSPKTS